MNLEVMAIKFEKEESKGSATPIPIFNSPYPQFPLVSRSVIGFPISAWDADDITMQCCLRMHGIDVSEPPEDYFDIRLQVEDSTGRGGILNRETKVVFSQTPPFASIGSSDYFIPIAIDVPLLKSTFELHSSIDFVDLDLHFSWKDLGEPLHKYVRATPHKFHIRFYFTMDFPQYPFGSKLGCLAEGNAGVLPWEFMIRYGVVFARGIANYRPAIKSMIRNIWAGGFFKYSEMNLGGYCSSNPNLPQIFGATALKECLLGEGGNGKKIDCADASAILMVLANAIGCKLNIAKLIPTQGSQGFSLNTGVVTLGNTPPPPTLQWHQIAFYEEFDPVTCTMTIKVYDLCFAISRSEKGNGVIEEFAYLAGIPLDQYMNLLFEKAPEFSFNRINQAYEFV